MKTTANYKINIIPLKGYGFFTAENTYKQQ